ncbi:PREDICTED: uncharacterized protein LOC105456866 [Wasmannia auropunctata]|uniref:uncharacterized protein LOC105456866 n=1 Tax=Wasmannia auropunctata TaxID=64793 RepID=UPI0005EF3993|nr:PREDICTED: uncharacterized protein LOC105456866 [Wasmannia auropunctata]
MASFRLMEPCAAVRAGRPCLYRGEKIFEPCADRAAAVSHERDYLPRALRGSARSPPRVPSRARGGLHGTAAQRPRERRWSPPTGVSTTISVSVIMHTGLIASPVRVILLRHVSSCF